MRAPFKNAIDCAALPYREQSSMPMTCFLAFLPIPRARLRLAKQVAISSILASATCLLPAVAHAQFSGNTFNDLTNQGSTNQGSTNLSRNNENGANERPRQSAPANGQDAQPEPLLVAPGKTYTPGEFEQYVQHLPGGDTVQRFGANLVTDDAIASATQDPLPSIPADYIIRPGDEIALTIWGTIDADLQLTVDRAGRISVPHVGAISVAGLRNGDLADSISHRVGQTFKNFQLTATLGHVRAIRVFVSGYVERPGTVTVSGLSSVLHAIMRAGGPTAAGSFRDIHLRRAGKETAVFDLYDLLLKGDRNSDRLVQPDDILFVGAVGAQVAVLGSVNQPAVYELKATETLDDVLRMAGGFTAVADRSRVTIERLADRTSGKVSQLLLPAHQQDILATGDVIRAFSAVAVTLPQDKQNQHVRVEGEVMQPGDYILPPGSHVEDALRMAGGLTPQAYVFGTEFTRETVRRAQIANYERALRDFETEIAKTQANQRTTSTEEINSQAASAQANARLLERLRQVKPTGRVVLPLTPDATTLPNMPLEDGDTLTIPQRGSSVGIFGSVFNAGSFVFQPGHTTEQYLALAGGPTRGADNASIFMIRANGSVVSAQQGSSFWHSGNDFRAAQVEPGDTIFVPEELNKSTFVQGAKDWTQILYQFGLGLAGIKTLGL